LPFREEEKGSESGKKKGTGRHSFTWFCGSNGLVINLSRVTTRVVEKEIAKRNRKACLIGAFITGLKVIS